jgi:CHASE3 domain sensor protein
MLKDTSQRVKSITNRLVDILEYSDNRIDAYELSASLKNIRENASNGYLISGLASFKNKYNDTLVSYHNKISNIN